MRVLLKSADPAGDFSDVLDEACRTAGIDSAGGRAAASASISRKTAARLQQLAEHERGDRSAMPSASVASYLEHGDDARVAPAILPTDPKAIAGELAISARMSLAELRRLRRAFARANHPDRVDAHERDIATRRMTIANMLIDCELKRRHTR
jgi:hypothetical protein